MSHKGLLDHSEVRLFVANVRFQDFADGPYWSQEAVSEDVAAEEGTNGSVTFIKTGSGLWTGTLTLLSSSQENAKLWAIRTASKNTPGGLAVPLAFSHKTTNFLTVGAMIRRAPSRTYSRTGVEATAWSWWLPDYDGLLGGFELDTTKPLPQAVLDVLNA